MYTSMKTGFGALVAASLMAAFGCGGSTDGGSGGRGAVNGEVCTQSGQQTFAADGCNTCTCDGGVWACTTKECSSACTGGTTSFDGCNTCSCIDGSWACTRRACNVCTNGQTSNDGCNTCSCSEGQWVCTEMACPPKPECPAPIEPGPGESCIAMLVYAKDPMTGICCEYGACSVPMGWTTYNTLEACQGTACVDGQTMAAGDGCNTCSCSGGQWMCTLMACPPQDAGPGYKMCGGFAGFTCEANEYCAYEAGQMCGAADASSVCKPRPEACDLMYAPVCGCDQQTYGNACAAAAAGQGVYSVGQCPIPAL